MNTQPSQSQEEESRWWISTQGKAEGPYSETYILTALKTNSLPSTAHACPVGGSEWKLISFWPVFAGTAQVGPDVAPPSPYSAPNNDSPLTNPLLPTMANWICIYSIVVAPALWVLDNLTCVMSGTTFHEESELFGIEALLLLFDAFFSLIIAVLMVIGGLRLRALRASGPTILKATIMARLAMTLLLITLFVGLLVTASDTDMAESTTAGDLIIFLSTLVDLAALAFEIVAIVWLHRNSRTLHLTNA